jgi:drug/metabolite transporter (DMT)-like permease
MMKSRRVALSEGILAGFLFSTAAIFIRLLPEVNSFWIVFWRLIIACAALAVILLILRKTIRINFSWRASKEFLILGFLLGSHFILFVLAVRNTSLLNATVLVNTVPIFSMFISTFIYSTKPSKLALIGMILSFLGAGVITMGDIRSGVRGSMMGDLAAILAAVAESIYLNYGRERRRRLPLLSTMLGIYFAALITIGVGIMLTKSPFDAIENLGVLLPLVGLGILPTAAAHTLFFSSLSNLKSYETATMALLEPLGATLLGAVIFAEVPLPIFILGSILVLAGIFAIVSGD